MSRRAELRLAAGRGFSLVEVAVSLLLISVATLGLAGLQISARAMGFQALQRTEAAALAADLLERMRANRTALPDYAVDGGGAAAGGTLSEPGRDCSHVPCSAADRAHWDTREWLRALDGAAAGGASGGLVRPLGCVAVDGRLVTVEIAWEGHRDLSDPAVGDGCGSGLYGPGDARRQLLRLVSFIGEVRD